MQKRLSPVLKETFWLTRILFIKFLGFILIIAFSISLFQNIPLIGPNGLTSSARSITRHKTKYLSENKTLIDLFLTSPTIYWWIPISNVSIGVVAVIGLGLSLFIMWKGQSNLIINIILWLFYLSIINIGGVWYSFGWESQVLETIVLASLVVPVLDLNPFPKWTPTPAIGRWGNIWLLFRIMIGAGLIKIRRDQCWLDLTCLNYHYLTQPVPNPLSTLFHSNFDDYHKFETATNHVVELILPWLLLVPVRSFRLVGAIIQIIFQGVIMLSGNFAFLNWLTIIPALLCLDDYFLASIGLFDTLEIQHAFLAESIYRQVILSSGWFTIRDEDIKTRLIDFSMLGLEDWSSEELISELKQRRVQVNLSTQEKISSKVLNNISSSNKKKDNPQLSWAKISIYTRRLFGLVALGFLIYGSVPILRNLFSTNQVMNYSYDPFRMMNSYGLFGTITRERNEVIIQGTLDNDPYSKSAKWLEYEFPCKPGDINRRPCIITPYHYRMDWQLWFAAFQDYNQCPWIVHLSSKLLEGDATVRQVLAPPPRGDPFQALEVKDNQKRIRKYLSTCSNTNSDKSIGYCNMRNISDIVGDMTTILPRFVRIQLYKYEYSTRPFVEVIQEELRDWFSFYFPLIHLYKKKENKITKKMKAHDSKLEEWEEGRWWRRKFVREYMPPISLNDSSVQLFLRSYGLVD